MNVDTVKDSLCFKLHLASRVMTGLYKPLLHDLELTFPQFLVMGLLWERDGQTIKSLGQQLHLDSGTLTPLVKRLERAGLILRQKSVTDERSNNIVLTPTGDALKLRGIAAAETFYQNLMLEEDDITNLKNILGGWLDKQLKAGDLE